MKSLRRQEQYQDKTEFSEGTVGVRAVERAIDILVCLGNSELNLSEISKEVNLNKSTVYRMLVSLERKGFVTKYGSKGKYLLGWRIFELLSGSLSRNQGLVQRAFPYMEKMWKTSYETILLYIQKGFNRLCIAEIPSPHPLKYTVGIGFTVPLYAGAPGKLLLANFPEAEQARVLEQINLRPLTNKTITDKEHLLQELELVQKQGWATSFGERIEGVSCLAVPVTNRQERVVASLSILGPYVRLPEERLMNYLGALKEAARGISGCLCNLDFNSQNDV